jgi:hypothetical protein
MTGVAVALFLLAAGVLWGVVVDHLRHIDERHNQHDDEADHHRQLMREIRRNADNDVRWRP